MEVASEPVDLDELVRGVANTVRPLVEQRLNRLELCCPPRLGRVETDGVKLRQILRNLLSNAAKFTENGAVTFEAELDREGERGRLRLRVADTGVGMKQAQLAGLFQPFMHGDSVMPRESGGTGLGLTITERFVNLMGGTLSVESEPGVGTTVRIYLPKAEARSPVFRLPGMGWVSGGAFLPWLVSFSISMTVFNQEQLDSRNVVSGNDLATFPDFPAEIRAPQGTLFGASAMGGMIRVITNRPDATQFQSAAAADVFITHGGDQGLKLDGMVNVPLIEDKLAVRLVASSRDEGGWIDRVPTDYPGLLPDELPREFAPLDTDIDDEEDKAARVSAHAGCWPALARGRARGATPRRAPPPARP